MDQIHAVDPYYILGGDPNPRQPGLVSYADIAAGRISPNSRGGSPQRAQRDEPPPQVLTQILHPAATRRTIVETISSSEPQVVIQPVKYQQLQSQPPEVEKISTQQQISNVEHKPKREQQTRTMSAGKGNVPERQTGNPSIQKTVERPSRRRRSPTRKETLKQKEKHVRETQEVKEVEDVPSIQVEHDQSVQNVREVSQESQIHQSDGLAPRQIRGRSPSPMWIPGSTSYADMVRGKMQESIRASSEPASDSRDMVNISREMRHHVSHQDDTSFNQSSRIVVSTVTVQETLDGGNQQQNETHLPVESRELTAEPDLSNIAPDSYESISQLDTSKNAEELNREHVTHYTEEPRSWADEPVESYTVIDNKHYENVNRPQTEIYDYIHPMPELVGFISSQLGAYPVTSYVYTQDPQQVQTLDAMSLNPYESHMTGYSGEQHYVTQGTYLQTTSELYHQHQQTIVQQTSTGNTLVSHCEMVQEQVSQNPSSLVQNIPPSIPPVLPIAAEQIPEHIEHTEQTPEQSTAVLSVSETSLRNEQREELTKDQRESSVPAPDSRGHSFSYAQILSQGLSPKATTPPRGKAGSEQQTRRSSSPKESTPPESVKLEHTIDTEKLQLSQGNKNNEWDVMKKKDIKKKQYQEERPQREEERKGWKLNRRSDRNTPPKQSTEITTSVTVMKELTELKKNVENIQEQSETVIVERNVNDVNQGKKRKQKKKKVEKTQDDEIEKALKEIEDMNKPKPKSVKEKSKTPNKPKENIIINEEAKITNDPAKKAVDKPAKREKVKDTKKSVQENEPKEKIKSNKTEQKPKEQVVVKPETQPLEDLDTQIIPENKDKKGGKSKSNKESSKRKDNVDKVKTTKEAAPQDLVTPKEEKPTQDKISEDITGSDKKKNKNEANVGEKNATKNESKLEKQISNKEKTKLKEPTLPVTDNVSKDRTTSKDKTKSEKQVKEPKSLEPKKNELKPKDQVSSKSKNKPTKQATPKKETESEDKQAPTDVKLIPKVTVPSEDGQTVEKKVLQAEITIKENIAAKIEKKPEPESKPEEQKKPEMQAAPKESQSKKQKSQKQSSSKKNAKIENQAPAKVDTSLSEGAVAKEGSESPSTTKITSQSLFITREKEKLIEQTSTKIETHSEKKISNGNKSQPENQAGSTPEIGPSEVVVTKATLTPKDGTTPKKEVPSKKPGKEQKKPGKEVTPKKEIPSEKQTAPEIVPTIVEKVTATIEVQETLKTTVSEEHLPSSTQKKEQNVQILSSKNVKNEEQTIPKDKIAPNKEIIKTTEIKSTVTVQDVGIPKKEVTPTPDPVIKEEIPLVSKDQSKEKTNFEIELKSQEKDTLKKDVKPSEIASQPTETTAKVDEKEKGLPSPTTVASPKKETPSPGKIEVEEQIVCQKDTKSKKQTPSCIETIKKDKVITESDAPSTTKIIQTTYEVSQVEEPPVTPVPTEKKVEPLEQVPSKPNHASKQLIEAISKPKPEQQASPTGKHEAVVKTVISSEEKIVSIEKIEKASVDKVDSKASPKPATSIPLPEETGKVIELVKESLEKKVESIPKSSTDLKKEDKVKRQTESKSRKKQEKQIPHQQPMKLAEHPSSKIEVIPKEEVVMKNVVESIVKTDIDVQVKPEQKKDSTEKQISESEKVVPDKQQPAPKVEKKPVENVPPKIQETPKHKVDSKDEVKSKNKKPKEQAKPDKDSGSLKEDRQQKETIIINQSVESTTKILSSQDIKHEEKITSPVKEKSEALIAPSSDILSKEPISPKDEPLASKPITTESSETNVSSDKKVGPEAKVVLEKQPAASPSTKIEISKFDIKIESQPEVRISTEVKVELPKEKLVKDEKPSIEQSVITTLEKETSSKVETKQMVSVDEPKIEDQPVSKNKSNSKKQKKSPTEVKLEEQILVADGTSPTKTPEDANAVKLDSKSTKPKSSPVDDSAQKEKDQTKEKSEICTKPVKKEPTEDKNVPQTAISTSEPQSKEKIIIKEVPSKQEALSAANKSGAQPDIKLEVSKSVEVKTTKEIVTPAAVPVKPKEQRDKSGKQTTKIEETTHVKKVDHKGKSKPVEKVTVVSETQSKSVTSATKENVNVEIKHESEVAIIKEQTDNQSKPVQIKKDEIKTSNTKTKSEPEKKPETKIEKLPEPTEEARLTEPVGPASDAALKQKDETDSKSVLSSHSETDVTRVIETVPKEKIHTGKAVIIEKTITTVTTTTAGSEEIKPPAVKSVKSVEILENVPLPVTVGTKETELITLRPENVEATLTTTYARVGDVSSAPVDEVAMSLGEVVTDSESQVQSLTVYSSVVPLQGEEAPLFGSVQDRSRSYHVASDEISQVSDILGKSEEVIEKTEQQSGVALSEEDQLFMKSIENKLKKKTKKRPALPEEFIQKESQQLVKESISSNVVSDTKPAKEVDSKETVPLDEPVKTVLEESNVIKSHEKHEEHATTVTKLEEKQAKKEDKQKLAPQKVEPQEEPADADTITESLLQDSSEIIKPYWLNYHTYAEAERKFHQHYTVIRTIEKQILPAAPEMSAIDIEKIVQESKMKSPKDHPIPVKQERAASVQQEHPALEIQDRVIAERGDSEEKFRLLALSCEVPKYSSTNFYEIESQWIKNKTEKKLSQSLITEEKIIHDLKPEIKAPSDVTEETELQHDVTQVIEQALIEVSKDQKPEEKKLLKSETVIDTKIPEQEIKINEKVIEKIAQVIDSSQSREVTQAVGSAINESTLIVVQEVETTTEKRLVKDEAISSPTNVKDVKVEEKVEKKKGSTKSKPEVKVSEPLKAQAEPKAIESDAPKAKGKDAEASKTQIDSTVKKVTEVKDDALTIVQTDPKPSPKTEEVEKISEKLITTESKVLDKNEKKLEVNQSVVIQKTEIVDRVEVKKIDSQTPEAKIQVVEQTKDTTIIAKDKSKPEESEVLPKDVKTIDTKKSEKASTESVLAAESTAIPVLQELKDEKSKVPKEQKSKKSPKPELRNDNVKKSGNEKPSAIVSAVEIKTEEKLAVDKEAKKKSEDKQKATSEPDIEPKALPVITDKPVSVTVPKSKEEIVEKSEFVVSESVKAEDKIESDLESKKEKSPKDLPKIVSSEEKADKKPESKSKKASKSKDKTTQKENTETVAVAKVEESITKTTEKNQEKAKVKEPSKPEPKPTPKEQSEPAPAVEAKKEQVVDTVGKTQDKVEDVEKPVISKPDDKSKKVSKSKDKSTPKKRSETAVAVKIETEKVIKSNEETQQQASESEKSVIPVTDDKSKEQSKPEDKIIPKVITETIAVVKTEETVVKTADKVQEKIPDPEESAAVKPDSKSKKLSKAKDEVTTKSHSETTAAVVQEKKEQAIEAISTVQPTLKDDIQPKPITPVGQDERKVAADVEIKLDSKTQFESPEKAKPVHLVSDDSWMDILDEDIVIEDDGFMESEEPKVTVDEKIKPTEKIVEDPKIGSEELAKVEITVKETVKEAKITEGRKSENAEEASHPVLTDQKDKGEMIKSESEIQSTVQTKPTEVPKPVHLVSDDSWMDILDEDMVIDDDGFDDIPEPKVESKPIAKSVTTIPTKPKEEQKSKSVTVEKSLEQNKEITKEIREKLEKSKPSNLPKKEVNANKLPEVEQQTEITKEVSEKIEKSKPSDLPKKEENANKLPEVEQQTQVNSKRSVPVKETAKKKKDIKSKAVTLVSKYENDVIDKPTSTHKADIKVTPKAESPVTQDSKEEPKFDNRLNPNAKSWASVVGKKTVTDIPKSEVEISEQSLEISETKPAGAIAEIVAAIESQTIDLPDVVIQKETTQSAPEPQKQKIQEPSPPAKSSKKNKKKNKHVEVKQTESDQDDIVVSIEPAPIPSAPAVDTGAASPDVITKDASGKSWASIVASSSKAPSQSQDNETVIETSQTITTALDIIIDSKSENSTEGSSQSLAEKTTELGVHENKSPTHAHPRKNKTNGRDKLSVEVKNEPTVGDAEALGENKEPDVMALVISDREDEPEELKISFDTKKESTPWADEIEDFSTEPQEVTSSENGARLDSKSWAAVVGTKTADKSHTVEPVVITREHSPVQSSGANIPHVQILVEEVPIVEPIENIVDVDDQGFMEFLNRKELRSRRSRSRSRSAKRGGNAPLQAHEIAEQDFDKKEETKKDVTSHEVIIDVKSKDTDDDLNKKEDKIQAIPVIKDKETPERETETKQKKDSKTKDQTKSKHKSKKEESTKQQRESRSRTQEDSDKKTVEKEIKDKPKGKGKSKPKDQSALEDQEKPVDEPIESPNTLKSTDKHDTTKPASEIQIQDDQSKVEVSEKKSKTTETEKESVAEIQKLSKPVGDVKAQESEAKIEEPKDKPKMKDQKSKKSKKPSKTNEENKTQTHVESTDKAKAIPESKLPEPSAVVEEVKETPKNKQKVTEDQKSKKTTEPKNKGKDKEQSEAIDNSKPSTDIKLQEASAPLTVESEKVTPTVQEENKVSSIQSVKITGQLDTKDKIESKEKSAPIAEPTSKVFETVSTVKESSEKIKPQDQITTTKADSKTETVVIERKIITKEEPKTPADPEQQKPQLPAKVDQEIEIKTKKQKTKSKKSGKSDDSEKIKEEAKKDNAQPKIESKVEKPVEVPEAPAKVVEPKDKTEVKAEKTQEKSKSKKPSKSTEQEKPKKKPEVQEKPNSSSELKIEEILTTVKTGELTEKPDIEEKKIREETDIAVKPCEDPKLKALEEVAQVNLKVQPSESPAKIKESEDKGEAVGRSAQTVKEKSVSVVNISDQQTVEQEIKVEEIKPNAETKLEKQKATPKTKKGKDLSQKKLEKSIDAVKVVDTSESVVKPNEKPTEELPKDARTPAPSGKDIEAPDVKDVVDDSKPKDTVKIQTKIEPEVTVKAAVEVVVETEKQKEVDSTVSQEKPIDHQQVKIEVKKDTILVEKKPSGKTVKDDTPVTEVQSVSEKVKKPVEPKVDKKLGKGKSLPKEQLDGKTEISIKEVKETSADKKSEVKPVPAEQVPELKKPEAEESTIKQTMDRQDIQKADTQIKTEELTSSLKITEIIDESRDKVSSTEPKFEQKPLKEVKEKLVVQNDIPADIVGPSKNTEPRTQHLECEITQKAKVQFYIDDEVLDLSKHEEKLTLPKEESGLTVLSRFIPMDSGFWFEKWNYHEAERTLFENLAAVKQEEKENENEPSDKGPHDKDDDNDDNNSRDKNLKGQTDATNFESSASAPHTERLVADLPGGIGSWTDYSTYLATEPLEDQEIEISDDTSELARRMAEEIITDLDVPDSPASEPLTSSSLLFHAVPQPSSSLGRQTETSMQRWSSLREVERDTMATAVTGAERIRRLKVRHSLPLINFYHFLWSNV